jgi:hypothetical protein
MHSSHANIIFGTKSSPTTKHQRLEFSLLCMVLPSKTTHHLRHLATHGGVLASNNAGEHTPTCWAVEFKPKAGYRPNSPLVLPRRQTKFPACWFQLLQQLKNKKKSSSYVPLDLFSNNHERIRSSLDSLIAYPQSNLQLWKYEDGGVNTSSSLEPTTLSSSSSQQRPSLVQLPCDKVPGMPQKLCNIMDRAQFALRTFLVATLGNPRIGLG